MHRDTPLLTLPLAYIRSGNYYWYDDVSLHGNANGGRLWAKTIRIDISSKHVAFGTTTLRPQIDFDKGYGLSVR